MVHFIKTRTSTGETICKKDLADNWWGTYHDICLFGWSLAPKCYDRNGEPVPYWAHPTERITNPKAEKMVCIDRQRDITVTLLKA